MHVYANPARFLKLARPLTGWLGWGAWGVGLATLVLYPDLVNKEEGYVRVFVDHLPTPWRGVMLAGFAAAYMSTMATQLNWGASYIVNDFYKRFVRKNETEKHYVGISRITTVLLFVLALLASYSFTGAVPLYFVGTLVEKTWRAARDFGEGEIAARQVTPLLVITGGEVQQAGQPVVLEQAHELAEPSVPLGGHLTQEVVEFAELGELVAGHVEEMEEVRRVLQLHVAWDAIAIAREAQTPAARPEVRQ